MCIAIYKPAGKDIPKQHLHSSWEQNRDGAGFAYVTGGKVEIRKGYFGWAEFWEAYQVKQRIYGSNSPFLIHFRDANVGTVGYDNCHPMRISDDVAMIHNGTIDDFKIDNSRRSDTWHFSTALSLCWNDEAKKRMMEKDTLALLEMMMGTKSKLLFINSKGEVQIVNEKLGNWKDKIWYSNFDYEEKKNGTAGGCSPKCRQYVCRICQTALYTELEKLRNKCYVCHCKSCTICHCPLPDSLLTGRPCDECKKKTGSDYSAHKPALEYSYPVGAYVHSGEYDG